MPDNSLQDRIRQVEDLLARCAPEADTLGAFGELVDAADDEREEALASGKLLNAMPVSDISATPWLKLLPRG